MRNNVRKIIAICVSLCIICSCWVSTVPTKVYAEDSQIVYYGLHQEFQYDQFFLDGKLKISSPYLYEKSGQTVMIATVTNISEHDISEFTLVEVYFYDKDGNNIKVLDGIISPLQSGQSTQFNMSQTLCDYASKAFSYLIRVKGTGEWSTLQKDEPTEISPGVNVSLANSLEGQLSIALQDVKFADGTLKGPSLDIMDGKYTFTPLNMEFNAGLPLSSLKHQAVIDTKNRMIYVMLGVSKNGKSSIEQTSDMTDWTWSKQYNDLKTFYKNIAGYDGDGKNWNNFQKLKGELDRMGCDMFIHAYMSISGYMEFDYSDGQIKFREGGIVEEVDTGASFKFPIYGNLVYTSIGLTVTEKGSIILEQQNSVVVPTCELSLSTTATASITGRIPLDLLSAEGGINAKLMGILSTQDPKFVMHMKGDIFVKISALMGMAELFNQSWNYLDATIYPEFKNNLQKSARQYLAANCLDALLENAVSAEREEQIDNYSVNQVSGYEFAKRVYAYNSAKLISLDNVREMLIWLDDNGEKSEKNRTSLMYSIFDGSEWSEPQAIYEDGSFFGEFDVDQDINGNVYIAFQKGTEVFEESLLYSDIVRKVDPYLVTFDGNGFSMPIHLVGDNTNYESELSVCASDEGATVSWIEYSDEYLAGESDLISVCQVVYDKTQNICDEKNQIRSTSNSLFYTAETKNGTYVVEKDNETEGYLLNRILNGVCENIDSFEQITQLVVENNVVYYLKNGELCWTDGTNVKSIELTCTDNFQICTSNSEIYVVFDYYDGEKTTIYSTKINGETVEEAQIYGLFDGYVKNYSICIDGTNELQMAVGRCDLDIRDDGFDYVNMMLETTKKREFVSLKAEAAFYEDEELLPGEVVPLTFQVTNGGNISSGQFSVVLLDENGNKITEQEYYTSIEPEATKEFTLDLYVDEDLERQTLKVRLISEEDSDIGDNEVDVEIGFADLCLDNITLEECIDKGKVSGKVVNLGYEKCENVHVNLVETTSTEDIVLATYTFSDLDRLSEKNFDLIFSQDDIILDDDMEDVTFTIEVASETEESSFANNLVRLYEEKEKFSEEYYVEGVNAHIVIIDESKEPTCIDTGLTEGSHCKVCGKVIQEQNVVATGEHDFSNQPYQTDVKEKHYKKCKYCGAESDYETCTPGEVVVENVIPPTYGKAGSHYEVVYCSICNQKLSTKLVIDPAISTGANNGSGNVETTNDVIVSKDPESNTCIIKSSPEVKVEKGIANATVKAKNITEAIKQAIENGATEIVFSISEEDSKEADKIQLTLSKSDAQQILDKTGASLVVDTIIGDIILSQDTLKEVVTVSEGQTLTIGIGRVTNPTEIQQKVAGENGHIVEVTVSSQDKEITSFGGSTMKIRLAIPDSLLDKEVAVVYIAGDGSTEKLFGEKVTEGEKQYYEFDTTKLSTFALIEEKETKEEESRPEENQPEEETPTVSYPKKGTILTGSKTLRMYKITKAGLTGGTVQFIGTKNKTATSITIPATVTFGGITYKVTSIAAGALKNNKVITKVVIGKNVTVIGTGGFSGCTKLKSVTIGTGVVSINSKAFYNCTSLTTLTIPASVTKIWDYAFKGCSKLSTLKVNSTKLTTKTLSGLSMKGISTKTVIKVPKSKVKTYAALFVKKGLSKKVTVKSL